MRFLAALRKSDLRHRGMQYRAFTELCKMHFDEFSVELH